MTTWTRAVAATAAAALVSGLVAATAAPGARAADEDDPPTVRVMARNLYLGADVGVALELLPDMPAAAQFMWDQVAANDFSARVEILVGEAARARPVVIGLQEATTWSCRPGPLSSPETVFDFTQQFLDASAAAGVPYVIAERDGSAAINTGYEIPPIPFLTRVNDPETFQPLFASDTADCGFTIADALLVRTDLAGDVLAAGTSEYEERHAVVPVVFTIDRGYAWADIAIAGTTIRAVTTHLESQYAAGEPATSAVQAQQLVADLADTTIPVIVIGDFNSDPRDPRAPGAPNPGEQPEASEVCPAQPRNPTQATADPACSAYWTMIDAGYADSGPDAQDPANYSWGASGDLAGPDPQRLPVALAQGNPGGFTDRLDYVFTANGASAVAARVFGNTWPDGDVWPCDDPSQVATTEASSKILAAAGLGRPITGRGVCLPTDHAGILAVVDVSAGPPGAVTDQPAPPEHSSFHLGLLAWLGIIAGVLIVLVALIVWGIVRLITRPRRRRRAAERAASAT